MKSKADYVEIDLEALPADFIPRTSYQPVRDANGIDYDGAYDIWHDDNCDNDDEAPAWPARKSYRVVWRSMAARTGFRTLYAGLIPPGASHVHAVRAAGYASDSGRGGHLLFAAGAMSSICLDFQVKAAVGSEISSTFLGQLPYPDYVKYPGMFKGIAQRAAKLLCQTSAYSEIWNEVHERTWRSSSPARLASERRRIQIEIDVLSAIGLGLTSEELCVIYRTQFPVLQGYEQTDLYDSVGRKVPSELNKAYRTVGSEGLSVTDRQWTHPQSGVEYTFVPPFRSFDREEDMRAAYAKFSGMLEEHGEIIEDGE